MYRRRRTTTTAVLPEARRHEETATRTVSDRNSGVSDRGSAVNDALGTSLISSDSSSSRSSSPTILPIRRSAGSTRRRINRAARIPTGHSALDSTEQNTADSRDRAVNSTSNSLTRCPVQINSKPLTRSRRSALLRSPIFRLILSPESSPPPSVGTEADHHRSRNVELQSQTHASSLDDCIQLVSMEEPEARPVSRRSRTARSTTRTARISSISRRLSRQTPLPVSRPRSGRSPNEVSSAEIQAALNVVRTTSVDGADDECVICLDLKSNRSIILPCMHTFCFDCIYRWLTINPSCPLCKRLAHRIIHSILSDSNFTELLVSELQTRRTPSHRITGLSPTFDLEEDFPAVDEVSSGQQQSHHHFHYHLPAPSVRLLNLIDGIAHGSTARTSLFIPPILIPSTASLSQSSALNSGPDGAPRATSHRWSSDLGSRAESRRALLTGLVNNALRPRDSSILDGLLLRQLVYVFGFDSVPAPQEFELERDTSPEFLRANESQRHRLEAFIRRELRILAPWLAYSLPHESLVLRDHSPGTMDENICPAVTAPLICGAPGQLTETVELDVLTSRLMDHFFRVPVTNEVSLVDLLSSLPALTSPLVPTTYLSHFASEVARFARYSGTVEQYDSAVCLYRRRLNTLPFSPDLQRSRVTPPTRSDPRLAVYVASACWPRLRPGFSQPQGLITHPLINWLFQRLFVHSVSGSLHPARISGTGEQPVTIPEPFIFPSSFSPLCHPDCLRLASLSRALLESLPSVISSRPRPGSRSLGSSSECRTSPDHWQSAVNTGRMTNTELYPNRLLFQRLLSELIDQARFSEALSSFFSQHHIGRRGSSQRNNTAADDVLQVDESESSDHPDVTPVDSASPENGVSNRSVVSADSLRPALNVHGLALRRLNGLLLLFTARMPGNADPDEDWLSELLHMSLLPLNNDSHPASTSVIDLTVSRVRSLAPNVESGRDRFLNFSGTDWNFLRQSPWSADNSRPVQNSIHTTLSETVTSTAHPLDRPIVLSNVGEPLSSSANLNDLQTEPFIVPPENACSTLSNNSLFTTQETGWRRQTPACVVISSDSSDDESIESDANAFGLLTTDDGDASVSTSPLAKLSLPVSISQFSSIHRSQECDPSSPEAPNRDTGVADIEATASGLTLNTNIATNLNTPIVDSNAYVPDTSEGIVEPMDVDELAPLPGSKRFADSATMMSDGDRVLDDEHLTPTSLRSNKLARFDSFFANILHRLQYTSMPSTNERKRRSSPHLSEAKRNRHHTHRSSYSRNPFDLHANDSDCEILREYISVDSPSSCSSSSSRSTSSSSRSASSKGSSPRTRSTRSRSLSCFCKCDHSKRHRCHHRKKHRSTRHHHHHHHKHRKHSCCGHLKHRKHRVKHSDHCCCCSAVNLNKFCKFSKINRSFSFPLNSLSSPILISDDSCDSVVEAVPKNHSNSLVSPQSNTSDVGSTVDVCDGSVEFTGAPIMHPAPSDQINPRIVPATKTEVPTEELTPTFPDSSPSISHKLNIPIFEPSTVDDFYRFLKRFEPATSTSELAASAGTSVDTKQEMCPEPENVISSTLGCLSDGKPNRALSSEVADKDETYDGLSSD